MLSNQKDKKQTSILNDLKIVFSKIATIVIVFPHAVNFDKKDIFSLDIIDPIWYDLMKYVEYKDLSNDINQVK
jgi:hypothetical protein